ncbi:HAD family hydrolase [Pilimelia columellifera]|uniref:Hydrolase of the HAD superfamily n=1 Tax=Pilimelia columellifera subsp. columellifera TaxID=706583 RepID=A0ABP6AGL4_9ACTN
MPLLILALDNTVIDRTGPFRAWAQRFLADLGAPAADLDWLMGVDADGLTSRWDVADAIIDRYRLTRSPYGLAEELHEGPLARTRLSPLTAGALRIARDAGWTPVIATNGSAHEQEDRIRRTGLDRYVADWLISEEVGVSKPNPRIFQTLARRVGMRLEGAWIIGDSPEADISGACSLGLRSVWIHRGRNWIEPRYEPTRTAANVVSAIGVVLGVDDVVTRSSW